MFKFLTKAIIFASFLPPIGDLPKEELENEIENLSWVNSGNNDEIKFIFLRPIKKGDKISNGELHDFFKYKTEIITTADTIDEAASKSLFLLEQTLDNASFFGQSDCKILDFISIVNLTQIEEVIKKGRGSFEKGFFRKRSVNETKAFPPGRLVFLTEKGIKEIGRNLFWFRRGITEFSVLDRFVSFFTSLKELDYYFQEESKKNRAFPSSLRKFLEGYLGLSPESFKTWSCIRNDIIHFSGRKKDYRKISKEARDNLPGLYEACYYGIAKFLTDNPPKPSPLIFYEDLKKEIVKATTEIVKQLKIIQVRREKGYKEVKLN